MKKYQLPEFLVGVITQERYERWLQRKSIAHVRRDRRRGNGSAKNVEYKAAIHDAITKSGGLDAYTKERLDWTLLGKWNNEEAKKRGRHHKREFYLLPSLDHTGDGRGKPEFKICAMLTNDVKSDLSYEELLNFCERLLRAAGRWPIHLGVVK
jgi:hypothetical protein